VFPIVLIRLIPEVGFGWAIRICAFLILALLVGANLTVTSRIPPTKRPFRIQAFIKPLGELPFALLTAAIFFFYCECWRVSLSGWVADACWVVNRGDVYTIHLYRCRGSA